MRKAESGARAGWEQGFRHGGKTEQRHSRGRSLERFNDRKLGWLHDSIHFIVLSVLLVVLFRFVIGVAAVGGESMFPTLENGDLVVYLRIVPNFRPGDIISMRVPAGDYYIKRVTAVGGDIVDLHDGQITVNGEPEYAPGAVGPTEEESGAVIYPYRVRRDNVFVLGDNRGVSMDSRAFGEVSRRQIKGRIILRIGRSGVEVPGRKESAA